MYTARRLRPIALVFALVAALLLPSFASAEDAKIAVVDLQKVLLSTKEGKSAKSKFEALQNKKKKQLKRKDDELKKREKELLQERVAIEKELADAAKAGATSIPEGLKAKAQAFQQKIMAFQKEVMEFQQAQKDALEKLQAKEAELLKPIEDKIRKHIGEIAKERGFAVVLSRVAVVYAVESVDITDEVSKRIGK
ncbi:MAG: OmpH family outer membrane protein [Deltaproteobacteria bacterium]|nr:OmpH family outer membrane protein [Deltaproteobacteria bacterium]